jgi:hypothetical protein
MVATIKPFLYLTLVFITFFQACSTSEYTLYAPSAYTAPFLKTKGDNQVSASVSANPVSDNYKSVGGRIQGAYALTNNIGITGAINYQYDKDVLEGYEYSSAQYNENRDWSTLSYKRKDAEAGIGYYKPFRRNQLSFNLFTGIGFGQVRVKESFEYSQGLDNLQNLRHAHNFYKWYLHPSFNLMPRKVFRLSVGTRLTVANFNTFTSELDKAALVNREWYTDRKTIAFIEPNFNLQVAIIPDLLYTHVGGSLSTELTTKDPDSQGRKNYTRDGFLFTGLTFEIGKRKKGKH